jgi:prepilin-type N-terminal cleavage/methylation domain-containing protein
MNPSKQSFSALYRRSGFTLMELMIVVVIIVLLVALGIPVAKNMRASAARTQCVNQLRSWGVAFGGYAADHDGKLEWRNWPSISWEEARCSVYVNYWTGSAVNFEERNDNGAFANQLRMRNCPSIKWNPAVSNSPVTYATIRPVDSGSVVSSTDYPLSKIKNPSRFMLMIEAMPASSYALASGADFTTRVKPLTRKGPDLRHNNTVNGLLADYSVRQMTWADVEKGLSYWNTF